ADNQSIPLHSEEWMCPICREVRQDIATASPCNHLFCVGCIQRWAQLRASCPLCRTAMKTIKVSVWGDNTVTQ
uniref:RING-type E3 ubiquitin transferase n=1 Tax=Pavo cristatus TaxID=9049 RepID=A0A8C9G0R5_PAVCR